MTDSHPDAGPQTVLVTGAASGIGAAVCREVAEHGARLVLLDHRAEEARGLADELREVGATVLSFECDVRDPDAVDATVLAAEDAGWRLTGLVTCAGIDLGGPAHRLEPAAWQHVLDTNLSGTFNACRSVLAHMTRHQQAGSLVLVSSPAAFAGFAAGGGAAYAASKGGVSALVRSLAVDYALRGIRVNALVPGATETPLMWAGVAPDERARARLQVESEIPLGRLADPREPARAAVWLLSSAASYVTGSHLVCDGGILAKASISL